MMFDIEATKEIMGDGDVIARLTVTIGETKKGISMDFGSNPTPKQVAVALRVLAMTLDPPELGQ